MTETGNEVFSGDAAEVANTGRTPEYITVAQAAAILHMAEVSVRRYLKIGKLRRFKVGGGTHSRTLISRSEVYALIQPAEFVAD